MSQPLSDAVGIDWKLVGSAVGVFIATIVTTVWGWMQGRKKSEKAAAQTPSDFQLAGAVLQDNTSLRDNTQAVRELRDQMLLLAHIMERHVRIQDDLMNDLRRYDRVTVDLAELIKRLDKAG